MTPIIIPKGRIGELPSACNFEWGQPTLWPLARTHQRLLARTIPPVHLHFDAESFVMQREYRGSPMTHIVELDVGEALPNDVLMALFVAAANTQILSGYYILHMDGLMAPKAAMQKKGFLHQKLPWFVGKQERHVGSAALLLLDPQHPRRLRVLINPSMMHHRSRRKDVPSEDARLVRSHIQIRLAPMTCASFFQITLHNIIRSKERGRVAFGQGFRSSKHLTFPGNISMFPRPRAATKYQLSQIPQSLSRYESHYSRNTFSEAAIRNLDFFMHFVLLPDTHCPKVFARQSDLPALHVSQFFPKQLFMPEVSYRELETATAFDAAAPTLPSSSQVAPGEHIVIPALQSARESSPTSVSDLSKQDGKLPCQKIIPVPPVPAVPPLPPKRPPVSPTKQVITQPLRKTPTSTQTPQVFPKSVGARFAEHCHLFEAEYAYPNIGYHDTQEQEPSWSFVPTSPTELPSASFTTASLLTNSRKRRASYEGLTLQDREDAKHQRIIVGFRF